MYFKILVHFWWQVSEELILITCSIDIMFTTFVTEDILHSCTKLWVMPIYQMTFTGMDVQSHIGQTLLWPRWRRMLLLIRVQTTSNHYCYTRSVRDDLKPNISLFVTATSLLNTYCFITPILNSMVILAIWLIKTYSLTIKIFWGF